MRYILSVTAFKWVDIVFLELQELRKDGFDLAEARYRELKPILDEVIYLFIFNLLCFQGVKPLPNTNIIILVRV